MGLDLTLMPVTNAGSEQFAHSRIDCHREDNLFDAIFNLEERIGKSVADKFYAYAETKYKNLQQTPYGKPVKTLTAGELAQFAKHQGVLESDINRAAWAYLKARDPKTRVALYWH